MLYYMITNGTHSMKSVLRGGGEVRGVWFWFLIFIIFHQNVSFANFRNFELLTQEREGGGVYFHLKRKRITEETRESF